MIRITYARQDKPLAEQIRNDLSNTYQVAPPLLIVLVSQAANQEPSVAAEIERARAERVRILPILTESVTLPALLAGMRPLDFGGGYDRDRLMRRLAQVTMTRADVRRANRRALAVIGAIAALMFGLAIVAMIGGLVAFPVAEYNEEATFQALWIDGMIGETLEYVQPRTTADALNFGATFEAAPTRLYYYVRGTATAIAGNGDE